MKKIISYLLIISTILILVSCSTGSEKEETNNDNNEDKVIFEEGWYKYTSTLDNNSPAVILYINFNSEKKITRMGNETTEFTGSGLAIYTDNPSFTWENIIKASDSKNVTFKKINENDLPTWIKSDPKEHEQILPEEEQLTYDKRVEILNKFRKYLIDHPSYSSRDGYKSDKIKFSNISNIKSDDETYIDMHTNEVYVTDKLLFFTFDAELQNKNDNTLKYMFPEENVKFENLTCTIGGYSRNEQGKIDYIQFRPIWWNSSEVVYNGEAYFEFFDFYFLAEKNSIEVMLSVDTSMQQYY